MQFHFAYNCTRTDGSNHYSGLGAEGRSHPLTSMCIRQRLILLHYWNNLKGAARGRAGMPLCMCIWMLPYSMVSTSINCLTQTLEWKRIPKRPFSVCGPLYDTLVEDCITGASTGFGGKAGDYKAAHVCSIGLHGYSCRSNRY